MKKFVTLFLALLTVAAMVLSLAACDKNNGVVPGDYDDVELDTPEQQEELADTLAAKIVANVPDDVDDEQALSQWLTTLGLKISSSLDFNADLDVDYEDAKMEFDGNLTMEQGSLINFAYSEKNGISLTSSASAEVKGGFTIPRVLFESIGLPSDATAKLQESLKNFNYGAKAYIDGDEAYLDLNEGFMSLFASLGVELSSGKIKMSLSDIGSFDPSVGFVGDVEEPVVDRVEMQAELSASIAELLNILKQYKVGVEVSKTKGYTLRLTVSEQTIDAILADRDVVPEEVAELINKSVAFKACLFELYISFGKDDKLAEISCRADFDASINIEKSQQIPVSVSGSIGMKMTENVVITADKVVLPADLGTYSELGLFQSPEYPWY